MTTVGEKRSSTCAHGARGVAVVREGALEEGGLGAEPHGLGDRHAGMDAEAARAVGGRLDDAPLVPPAADHQQLDVAQLGVPLAAHFDEEGVEIDVEDARAHGPLKFTSSIAPRDPGRARFRSFTSPASAPKGSLDARRLPRPRRHRDPDGGAPGPPRARSRSGTGPPSAREEFAERHGADAAATPREAAAAAEVVITCLGTSAEVASLLDGPDGLLAGLRRGALFLDCTSGDPADVAADRRSGWRSGGWRSPTRPVSGGTNGAEAGTLTVMVGADAPTFARARPVLAAFGRRIEHVGPVGAGDALKAVNNALLALNILAAGEGLAALVKAGVAPRHGARSDQRVERPLVRERSAGARAGPHRRLAADVPPGAARQGRRHRDRPAGETGVAGRCWSGGAAAARTPPGAELGEAADYLDPIRLTERQAGVEIRG